MFTRISISILAALAGLFVLASPAAATPLAWGTPVSISSNPLIGVSCPSAAFCVAVDGAVDGGGNAYTYDGSTWSGPVNISPTWLYSVSCPSAAFCVAGDAYGNVYTYDGSAWSTPTNISSSGLPSESCPSASFCVAVDWEGNAYTYDGSTWSGPASISPTLLYSVSCPSASFCVAVSGGGNVYTYDGSAWSTPTNISPNWLFSVSCPSASFCMAVDESGNAYTYDGNTWSGPASVLTWLFSVSCPSASFCVAVDYAGDTYTYDGSAWSEPANISPTFLFSVSCPSASFCIAVGEGGNAVIGKPPVPLTVEKLSTGTGTGNVVSGPPGIECLTGCPSQTAGFAEDSLVTLTASAAEDSIFKGWPGCVKNYESPELEALTGPHGRTCTVEMTKALTVRAKFMKVWPITAVKKAGSSGQGTISSSGSPTEIRCGSLCSTATARSEAGKTVLLKAIPVTATSTFTGWSNCDSVNNEGQCVVAITEAKSVEAEFTAIPPNPLSVTKVGDGYGSVSSSMGAIWCGPSCPEATALVLSTKKVILREVPMHGEEFGGWEGCDEFNEEGNCVVAMSGPREVTAEFK